MKAIKLISIVFVVSVLLGVVATSEAALYKLDLTDFQEIVDNDENAPDYGPPPAASFPNGPTSILSGGSQDLIAGPAPGQFFERTNDVDYLLFVISFNEALSDATEGSVIFNLTLDSTPMGSETLNYERYAADDFFDNDDIGFPDNIPGFGHGEVGGVKFPDALHGALLAELPDGENPFFPKAEGDIIGEVGVETDIFNLRIDVFSLILQPGGANGILFNSNGPDFSDLRIVGNNPNSHSLAVVPEPATMLLLGSGLIGFAVIGRKKLFKKK